MRILLGLCVVLLLGGCNRVHTDHPLFFASDAPDAPRLRDGVWLIEDGDDDCRFDERKPATRWPDCADWMLVRGGEFLSYGKPRKGDLTGTGDWTSLPFVLSDGGPPILQIGVIEGETRDYQFYGVEPTARSESGITALTGWPVMCGPPPPAETMIEGKRRYVSLDLLPGLTLTNENDCSAADAIAVRNAAGASREWVGEEGFSARWVRDRYP